jgi:ribosomal protein S25
MDNFSILTFAEARQPDYKEKKGIGYYEYGHMNDYPEYLLELYKKSAKHQALIKGKINYICGNGWKAGDVYGELFIRNANQVETLEEVTKKIVTDNELFGGFYLQVIWSMNGMISDIYHVDYSKVRTNKDNTEFWIKDNWKDRHEEVKVYPAFNPNFPKGSQILFVKEYRAGISIYPLPSYFGGLNYIESDIEVSKHVLGNAQTGFTPSKLITLPNGEPNPEEKRIIERKFENKFTGSDGKKFLLSFVNDSGRKPIIDDLGASDLTKEDFGHVDELIRTNIYVAHQITTPALFGIAEPGKLGTRQEMRDGYEIFKNTYINYKQRQIEAVINMIGSYRGVKEPMYLIAVEPIGIEFGEQTIAAVAPKEWILEKLGIDMSQYQTQQMSDEFIFEEFGEAASNFQVFKKKSRFDEYTDYELFATINQTKADILDLISKDKRITPEVIADTLKIDIDVVNRNIEDLIKSGSLAQGTENGVLIHELTAPLSELTKIEPETKSFMIRYSYEWKDIVPAGERNTAAHPSREFCKRLMSLDKFYSRSDIEQISARLGYSVWDRKGGWWTMPSGEHSPSCRHEWKSNIVMRKNK